QAIEKSLKAYLLNQGHDLKRTHKIIDLIAECSNLDAQFKQFEEDAVEIDRYYIPTRYPDALVGSLPEGLPKKEQAQEAQRIALKITQFIKKSLELK
ncbi:MAG: HEPN domain-containing protein, partial [Candidatus Margulisiibacteriota bacterium]